MEQEKYLPIGTVVMLKNGTKRLMIIGFCMEAKNDKEKVRYDYAGCLYPEGVVDSNAFPLFNHDQIEKIYNSAYTDEESIKFNKALSEIDFSKVEYE